MGIFSIWKGRGLMSRVAGTGEPRSRPQGKNNSVEASSELELSRQREWIARAAQVCEEAAAGNLEARLTHCEEAGDAGRLVHGINHLLDMTDAFLRESQAALGNASQGKFFRRVILRGMLGSFRAASEMINKDIESMARDAALKESIEQRKELADRFENTVKSVFSGLAASASHVNDVAQSLAAAAGDTSRMGTDQKESGGGTHPNGKARVQGALAGTVGKHQLNEVIGELTEASRRIGGTVKLISEIAGQTNLLALNASIEAAHAGESGRGFAVVAAAVKSLSTQTTGATEEIGSEITKMRTTVDDTAALVLEISKSIGEMEKISTQLSGQTDELSASVESFLQTIRA